MGFGGSVAEKSSGGEGLRAPRAERGRDGGGAAGSSLIPTGGICWALAVFQGLGCPLRLELCVIPKEQIHTWNSDAMISTVKKNF